MKSTHRANENWSISRRNDEISRRLVDARLNARPLSEFPDRIPESLEQAYAIQTASISRWPDDVAGWKIAKLPPPDRVRYSEERLAGPVFKSSIRTIDEGSCGAMHIYDEGFAAIEAEFVMELGASVPPSHRDYSDEELAVLVSAVYGGAEIASSPMASVVELGATSIISDLGINAGVVVGPVVPNWRTLSPDAVTVEVSVDGSTVGKTTAVSLTEGPLEALRFLLGHCAARGIELPAQTLVSTGMITGVHVVQPGSVARVQYGSFGWFDVKFEPMKGQRS